MASLPFLVEDQTDEDFFDKLVDDEFGITKPSGDLADSVESDEAKTFANLSINDERAGLEESGDIGLNSEGEDLFGSVVAPPPEVPTQEAPAKDIFLSEESVSLVSANSFSFDTVIESVDSNPARDAPVDSSTGKSNASGATSVKEVQWSEFGAESNDEKNAGGFGSYSDFFTELTDGSEDPFAEIGDQSKTDSYATTSLVENPVTDSVTSFSSSDQQQNNQAYFSEQTTDGQDLNNSQYLENLYPGWKYDPATGAWHQLDGYSASANTQVQDMGQSTGDNIVSNQQSEISYLQQTAQSVVGTVAEGCTTGSVSNWNQISPGSQEYPAHMVFDPQYPGWYYDTITQEWCLLESYTQAVQTSSTLNEQPTQDGNASFGGSPFSDKDHSLYNEYGQFEQHSSQGQVVQGQGGYWNGYASNHTQANMWQSQQVAHSGATASFIASQQTENPYSSAGGLNNYSDQQHMGFKSMETDSLREQPVHGYERSNGVNGFDNFTSTEYKFNQLKVEQQQQQQQTHFPHDNYDFQQSLNYSQQPFQNGNSSLSDFSHASKIGRSSAGRPPHALVTFGFGGKLVVLKDGSSLYGSQDSVGGSISILNLMEVVTSKTDTARAGSGACDYFHALCQQSFPGPLVGGNAASKEVSKWLDERIANCQSQNIDFRKGELLQLLFSLLKISCQHYGKLRSPFGIDTALQENDGPESALAKLFASARRNGPQFMEYSAFTHCIQNLPPETQIQTTAVEVQNLLVSGRRKEALQCAQEGQLWGPALVLAAQLGDKFYVDTIKVMAHRQFVSGSPLRTLCLLIAGQPADVFSADAPIYPSPSGGVNLSQPAQFLANGMLNDWEENLAIIATNRTKDDELVIIHLGDCLWKERGEVAAAHICYLVAEANFESYSDSARLCLIGGDHWKFPRTYASPEAIQRTEIYEYSKVLGNSQFILLPFQPYKLIYAYMLAEVGKVAESLRYCQAILKALKNSSRAPEVETLKSLLSSLEERIRTHQQGGYSTNLAPSKLVGKLFTSIDKSIHRMIGTVPPPPAPPSQENNFHSSEHNNSVAPKVTSSQSTMALSSLMASTEPEWAGGSNRMMPNRSISEPNFGRDPKQVDPSKDASPTETQSKASLAAPSRFGRFGSQILQKTMGWVSRSRPDRQAKLGEKNKFYYNEKLKMWVEEGAEPPAAEAALPPPPPTTASFQNGMPDYSVGSGFRSNNLPSNGGLENRSPNPPEQHSSGIPPIPPSTNQFSARGRMDVRSRYVDTFNKGGGTPTNLFQSPSVPATKPPGGAKFFVPTAALSFDQTVDAGEESSQEIVSTEGPPMSVKDPSVSSLSPLPSSSLQRFPSAGNIAPLGKKGMGGLQNGNGSLSSRSRAASWSGSYSDPSNPNTTEVRTTGEALGMQPSSFMPSQPSSMDPNSAFMPMNGGNFGDDLHEVEL